MQDVFVRVRSYHGSLKAPVTLAWLHAIANHVCFDKAKRRAREEPWEPPELDPRRLGTPEDADRRADEVRLKGSTEFGVYVKRAGEASPLRLASGAKVRAGEVLRFHYRPPSDGWLLLVSIDGTRQLTVFHPYQGTAAARVAGGTLSVLEMCRCATPTRTPAASTS